MNLRLFPLLAIILAFLAGCAESSQFDTSNFSDFDTASNFAEEKTITSTQVENLIAAGRAELGVNNGPTNGQCKQWASNVTSATLGVTLPSNDTSPASDVHKWTSDTTPATNVARWLGSYANTRVTLGSLAAGATSSSTNVTVPNSDPQVMVIYTGSTANSAVTATITKGSSSYSVTSSGTTGGTISAQFSGSGTWSLSVKNNGTTATSGNIVVAVISYSRFQSDWQTARRGDIMQMYADFTGSNKCDGQGPHTTFVQTDYNTNGTSTCSGSTTTGCNWLDSNWTATNTVGAHNQSMESMIKSMACFSTSGFTVYRLN